MYNPAHEDRISRIEGRGLSSFPLARHFRYVTSRDSQQGWVRIRRAEQKLAGAIAIRCGSLRAMTVMTMPDGRARR